jgi:hypothetical protein
MPNELESGGIDPASIRIADEPPSEPVVSEDDLTKNFLKKSVSISLKYYISSCECFSEWQARELKKFTGTIEKIGNYDADQLQRTKSLCDSHKGAPSFPRFSRPASISEDITFYEIKVDPSNKARIHGFFIEGVFFLVWLDRNHQCFKE